MAAAPPDRMRRGLWILAALGTAVAASTSLPPAPVLSWPTEGGGSSVLCDDELPSVGDGQLVAAVHEVSATLDLPARSWYGGGGELPQVLQLSPPTMLNGSCARVEGGSVLVEGAGLLYLSKNNFTNRTTGQRVQYYESAAVAFSMRPYLNEPNGQLLLYASPAVAPTTAATVSMHLPFATPARTVTWKVDLAVPEQVLNFTFDGLPATINQDVDINITLLSSSSGGGGGGSGGRVLAKVRRLLRAPPLPKGSPVLAVQVDHFERALRVDGRRYAGIGWYLDGLTAVADGGFQGYANITEYIANVQAPSGE